MRPCVGLRLFMLHPRDLFFIFSFIFIAINHIPHLYRRTRYMDNILNISYISDYFMLFFSIRVFFHRRWQPTWQHGKGGDHLLFHSTTSTRSCTFRHVFATLHVRWLSHIFNRNAWIYQTATRDLPPYRITIWLTDNVVLIFVCLLVDLILGFVCHAKPVSSY